VRNFLPLWVASAIVMFLFGFGFGELRHQGMLQPVPRTSDLTPSDVINLEESITTAQWRLSGSPAIGLEVDWDGTLIDIESGNLAIVDTGSFGDRLTVRVKIDDPSSWKKGDKVRVIGKIAYTQLMWPATSVWDDKGGEPLLVAVGLGYGSRMLPR